MCPYKEYRIVKNREYLFCKKTDYICDYSKFCGNQKRYILNERWEKCSIMSKKEIPKNSNRVLFEKRGYLYIELTDKAIKLKNIFDTIPDYVYVREGIDGYEMSLKPFELNTKKKNTTKNK